MNNNRFVIAAEDKKARLLSLETPPFGTNAYVLICRETGDSLLIDAPGETESIMKILAETKPVMIVITHGHPDHTGALSELQAALKLPVAVHEADAKNLPVPAGSLPADGDFITCGKLSVQVMHTPGHTPGSICLLAGSYLISGDTLFPGGPGRTRSPADFKQIVESIITRLFTLPDHVKVFPGHGLPTVLKTEKEKFAIFSSKHHSTDLCGDVLWVPE